MVLIESSTYRVRTRTSVTKDIIMSYQMQLALHMMVDSINVSIGIIFFALFTIVSFTFFFTSREERSRQVTGSRVIPGKKGLEGQ